MTSLKLPRIYITLILLPILSSCLGRSYVENRNISVRIPDVADAYIGIYDVSVIENVVWGDASATLSDSGTMRISKQESNRIMIAGFIATKATVTSDKAYLEPEHSDGSFGFLDVVYDVAEFDGTALVVYAVVTGQLATTENGMRYPYRSTQKYIAVKQQ